MIDNVQKEKVFQKKKGKKAPEKSRFEIWFFWADDFFFP
jgi:hypothetical protein